MPSHTETPGDSPLTRRAVARRPTWPGRAPWCAGVVLAVSLPWRPVAAQERVPERALGQAEAAAFPAPFGSIAGLRELKNGRVLVSDGLGQALVVADLTSGAADTLGAVGEGPDEYKGPDRLLPLPGDSTLLVDLGNGRLIVLGPSLEFGPTEPIARHEDDGPFFILPSSVDGRGRVYFQKVEVRRAGGALPDSGTVVRWDRALGQIEAVGRVKLEDRTRSESGGANNRSVRIRSRPLTPEDAWDVAPDGSLVIARAADYHVEWHRPDGRIVRGPPIPYRPVPVRTPDKEEWIEAASRGLQVRVSIVSGAMQTSFSRGGGRRTESDPDDFEWPDVKPAFPGNAVRAAPDGRAWVRRHVPAGEPIVYDLFGPDGRRQGRVRLPPGRRLVGFGEGTLYLMRRDAVDFEWLERYRAPTF
ncbi:MAG: hypothetical protein ACE5HP_09245 [Gemmatimonadota bacterium]